MNQKRPVSLQAALIYQRFKPDLLRRLYGG